MPDSLVLRRGLSGLDVRFDAPPFIRMLVAIAVATVLLSLGISAPAAAQVPAARLSVAFAGGSPAPPVLNQAYSYAIDVGNPGDVPLDQIVVIDTVPVEMSLSRVTTGAYTGLADFAAGEGVRVSYEKNTALGTFTLWGSSPNSTFNTTLTDPPPGVGAGEYVTRVRWEYGQAAPQMRATARPTLAGRVTNPDNAGGPVSVGDRIQNCVSLTAVPTSVATSVCHTFDLIAGPAIAIQAPDSTPLGSALWATATLSGGDPTGSITFSVFAASDDTCSTALASEEVTVDGVGTYTSQDFTALTAGAYKWVADYSGDVQQDVQHAGAATACGDPAGGFAVVAPPSVSASFGANEIFVGESTALTFTIANPPANTVPLTGVTLEDTLPPGLVVASPNGLSGSCGTGAITAAPGSEDVTLSDGTIPVGSECSFAVDVTASALGPVTHTTSAVESANGGTGNTATASLTVRERPAPAPAVTTPAAPTPTAPGPPTPQTSRALALACSPANLVLLAVTEAGRRVHVRGVADTRDAGRRVLIRTLPTQRVAAQATVLPDGSFEATGPRPSRRLLNKTRYFAELGERRSPSVKLTRRLTAQLTTEGATTRISGRVAPPLDKPIRRVVIRRLTSCGEGYETVARVKPGAGGRFSVKLAKAPGGGPALYLTQTQVRTKRGGVMGTFSLVLMESSV